MMGVWDVIRQKASGVFWNFSIGAGHVLDLSNAITTVVEPTLNANPGSMIGIDQGPVAFNIWGALVSVDPGDSNTAQDHLALGGTSISLALPNQRHVRLSKTPITEVYVLVCGASEAGAVGQIMQASSLFHFNQDVALSQSPVRYQINGGAVPTPAQAGTEMLSFTFNSSDNIQMITLDMVLPSYRNSDIIPTGVTTGAAADDIKFNNEEGGLMLLQGHRFGS